ncbi:hypothetical protein EB118_10495 [bacterium]|nr:hypothetical protein [bacterium]NDD83488.1 hypothetical protein [bacterium]NDG30485.1 hypothetical protein [bacterium]
MNNTPILQQPSSKINGHYNPKYQFTSIPNNNEQESIQHVTLHILAGRVADSCLGFFSDLPNKQKSHTFFEHLFHITNKDDRYAYIGILLIAIAFFISI